MNLAKGADGEAATIGGEGEETEADLEVVIEDQGEVRLMEEDEALQGRGRGEVHLAKGGGVHHATQETAETQASSGKTGQSLDHSVESLSCRVNSSTFCIHIRFSSLLKQ